MTARVVAQTKPAAKLITTVPRSNLLQRKCACGGTAGPTGECDACKKKKRLGLQTKLKVSEPGDSYEQEADRIADQMTAASPSVAIGGIPLRIQRFSQHPSGQMNPAPASVDQVLASPGRPLEPSLRQEMEHRFDYDFSRVRIHTDAAAEQSAHDVNAHAYTLAHHVVFGAGRFAPETEAGQWLIGHELTHVIQSDGDRRTVRRVVIGDITQQSIGPQFAKNLTDKELQDQAGLATAALPRMPPGSVERQALETNLALLEEEASLRGVDLPAVTAYTLFSVIQPLALDLDQMLKTLQTARSTKITFPGTKFSDVFDPFLHWGVDQLTWTTETLLDVQKLVNTAKSGGSQSGDLFRQAGTRFTAALFGAQAVNIWLAYVQTAAAGLSLGSWISTEYSVRRILDVGNKMEPTVKEFKSFDPARVETAVAAFPALAKYFAADYDKLIFDFGQSAEFTKKFMKFYTVYQLAFAVVAGFKMTAGMGGAGGAGAVLLRLPGIGGITAGGAATGVNIAISAEWLEMIRRLGMIGAISMGMTSSVVGLAYPGPGAVPSTPGPTVLLRATPSGTVTPSSGANAGRSVSYGDTRAKHTKVADHTLQEMKDALAKPSTAPADLNAMQSKIGDATYGSQLSKEATDNYAALVKDALENGTRTSATRIDHIASYEVGINIVSGQPTKGYTMFFSNAYGGWHVFPR